MFEVRFYNDFNGQYVTTAAHLDTIQEASDARCVSGDLVFNSKTNCIVTTYDWLWGWEKDNPKSYAKQKIDDAINKEKTK